MLTLTGLPRAREGRQEKRTVWNLAREGGWEDYEKLTEKHNEAFERIIEDKDNIEEKMINFEKLHDKVKFKAFGKVTIGGVNKIKDNNYEKEDVSAENSLKRFMR